MSELSTDYPLHVHELVEGKAMPEMVERVARAIERERWVIAMEQAMGKTVDSMEGSRRTSRAAIEALREPTDAMKWVYELPQVGPDEIGDCYKAMIDAALEGK